MQETITDLQYNGIVISHSSMGSCREIEIRDQDHCWRVSLATSRAKETGQDTTLK